MWNVKSFWRSFIHFIASINFLFLSRSLFTLLFAIKCVFAISNVDSPFTSKNALRCNVWTFPNGSMWVYKPPPDNKKNPSQFNWIVSIHVKSESRIFMIFSHLVYISTAAHLRIQFGSSSKNNSVSSSKLF